MIKNTTHLGCYGLIIKNDKIILVKKARGGYKEKLDLPGGSFEHGETPVETLKREIWEEVGSSIKSLELFDNDSVIFDWQNDSVKEHMHHIGLFYKVSIDNIVINNCADGHDSLGAFWYKISDLTESMVSPLTWIELKKLGYK